jgi:hypothetical protein
MGQNIGFELRSCRLLSWIVAKMRTPKPLGGLQAGLSGFVSVSLVLDCQNSQVHEISVSHQSRSLFAQFGSVLLKSKLNRFSGFNQYVH